MTESTNTTAATAVTDSERMAALARLASGFAHDINNLLGAIEGYASLAAAALPPGSQARKDAESACDAVKAAAELTGRLLLFGRRRAVSRENCEMRELLERAAARAREKAPAGVSVEVCLETAPDALQCVSRLLDQALDCLAANALAAMPGGGRLTLGAEKSGAGRVRIYARDNGCGISREALPHIFEPYYSGKPGGKGLGLAFVYGAAAAHGGTVFASSAGGVTEVGLELPAPGSP